MKCVHCNWDYPEGIVNKAFMGNGYVNLCGLCYEEIVGFKLSAPIATHLRNKALDYRNKNPDKAPK